MADNNQSPAQRGVVDRVKNGAAVLGAVAGTMTAVWGVYEKVRAEARKDTAASYNVLAPQVNQMNEAVKQLQIENQMLRQIVAQAQGKPRLAENPPAAPPPSAARRPTPSRRPTISAAGGSAPAAPTASAHPPTAGSPAPAGEPPPEAPPPTTPSGQPAGPAAEQAAKEPAPAASTDPVSGLLQTVGRTRQAIESLKKVPEDFEKVVGKPKE